VQSSTCCAGYARKKHCIIIHAFEQVDTKSWKLTQQCYEHLVQLLTSLQSLVAWSASLPGEVCQFAYD
jgi:hypothetical protein